VADPPVSLPSDIVEVTLLVDLAPSELMPGLALAPGPLLVMLNPPWLLPVLVGRLGFPEVPPPPPLELGLPLPPPLLSLEEL
jgi:hypothetical protein